MFSWLPPVAHGTRRCEEQQEERSQKITALQLGAEIADGTVAVATEKVPFGRLTVAKGAVCAEFLH